MKYFENCISEIEAQKEFKRLAMKFHPDKGGNAEIFQAIQEEYNAFPYLLKLKRDAQKAVKQKIAQQPFTQPKPSPVQNIIQIPIENQFNWNEAIKNAPAFFEAAKGFIEVLQAMSNNNEPEPEQEL